MRFKLDSQHLLDSLEVTIRKSKSSMTSLNIIGEVMNLPMSALECIWRKSDEQDVDPSSLCIDEKSLELFAEAYIRKMKNYFESSLKDFDSLSIEERNDLVEFYNKFVIKEGDTLTSKSSWSRIDSDKLHDAFINEVREKTEKYNIDFRGGIGNISLRFLDELCGSSVRVIGANNHLDPNNNLLNRISHSSRYLSPRTNVNRGYKRHHCIVNKRLRNTFKSARFYIYVADDNSDSHIIDSHWVFIKKILNPLNSLICTINTQKSLSIISERVIFL